MKPIPCSLFWLALPSCSTCFVGNYYRDPYPILGRLQYGGISSPCMKHVARNNPVTVPNPSLGLSIQDGLSSTYNWLPMQWLPFCLRTCSLQAREVLLPSFAPRHQIRRRLWVPIGRWTGPRLRTSTSEGWRLHLTALGGRCGSPTCLRSTTRQALGA